MTLNIGQLLEDAKRIREILIEVYQFNSNFGVPGAAENENDDDDVQAIDRIIAYFEGRYVPPSEPGSFREARGILEWREGDESAEASIRRVRDGE